MKKIIPFSKDIHFKNEIGEITNIKIEDHLDFSESYYIKGELTVKGTNKYQDTINDFTYPLPVSITIDTKYDTSHGKVYLDDFYYEIINDDILRVNIEVCLDGVLEMEEIRDHDTLEKEVIMDEEKKKVDDVSIKEEDIDSETDDLFKESEPKEYSVYRVYTVLDGDTIDSIIDKYSINREELEKYNDLSHFMTGMKLVIPSIDD